MTTVARPGTPFPHTHMLHHTTTHSSYSTMSPPSSSYFPTPIHFAPRALPTRTPPSLLKRSASSSSSTSSLGRTPSLIASRRDSATTISEEGSPRLQTPIMEDTESPVAPHPTPLELPSPLVKKRGLGMPPPTYNWIEKAFTAETVFDISSSSFDLCAKVKSTLPARPVFKRRDTPRPVTPTLSSLTSTKPTTERADRHRGKRRLTSMLDGGDWIVME